MESNVYDIVPASVQFIIDGPLTPLSLANAIVNSGLLDNQELAALGAFLQVYSYYKKPKGN